MTPASWAVRFAASREGVIMVLSGMSDYSQLLDNTAYMQDFVPLTEEEEGIVGRAAEIIQSATAIGCRRCEAICPQHLPVVQHMKEIAEVFEPAK